MLLWVVSFGGVSFEKLEQLTLPFERRGVIGMLFNQAASQERAVPILQSSVILLGLLGCDVSVWLN